MNIQIEKNINKKIDSNEIKIIVESSNKNTNIDNLIQYINNFNCEKVIVFDGYNMIQINKTDILCFYSNGDYNYCKTMEKEYRVKSKLYELEKMSDDYIRISKSCIVNLQHIISFDIGKNRQILIKLSDNSEKVVARRKIKEVMNFLDERII